MRKKIHSERNHTDSADMLSQKTNEDFNKQKPDPKSTGLKSTTVMYTCPMHPTLAMNEPGKCPKCGFRLIEKR